MMQNEDKRRSGLTNALLSHLCVGMTAVMLMFMVSACATPRAVHSKHEGFLDRLNKLGGRTLSQVDESTTANKSDSTRSILHLKAVASKWRWPLSQVQVTSPFGKRGDEFHDGVDLRAKIGTPVYAVAAGEVIYAGQRIRGYGKLVVIRHNSGLASVYAHNTRIFVLRGQKIKRGQKIAVSGKSGHVTGPHLHFEIRDGVAAIDPMQFLPKSNSTAEASSQSASKGKTIAIRD
jgi:murein DD-endopeptidase MepM/ murein hydrolase activator NlpD